MERIVRWMYLLLWVIIIAASHPEFAFAFAKKPSLPALSQTAEEKKYACPMQCVFFDKPGKCPKCLMEMWEVETSSSAAAASRI